jgi:hypothetical protein
MKDEACGHKSSAMKKVEQKGEKPAGTRLALGRLFEFVGE